MNDSISKGKRGGFVTLLGQGGKAAIQFISVIVLSRILSPGDFGLIAMVTAVVLLGDLMRDAGLTTSALKEPSLSKQQASNLFWINLALGLAVGLAIILSTPMLVAWYSEPRLTTIVPIVAVNLVFTGLQAQVSVQLARTQRYSVLALSDVSSQAIGLIFAIGFAIGGFGYWALVVQAVSAAGSLLTIRWFVAGWLPSVPRRGHGTRRLAKSGLDYAMSQILAYVASNIDTFVIGARWGATNLGVYNRAYQVLQVPLARALTPLNQVALPILGELQATSSNIFSKLLQLQNLIALPTVLVFATTAGSADSLIPLILGPQWEASVPIFQTLALAGAMHSLGHINYWALLIAVPSRTYFWSVVVTRVFTIISVVLGALHSVQGAAWGYSIGLLITWAIQLVWLRVAASMPVLSFATSGVRYVGLGVFAGLASYYAGALLEFHVVFTAMCQLAIGSSVFTLLLVSTRVGRRELVGIYRVIKDVVRR